MDRLMYKGDFLRTEAKLGLDTYDPSPELVEAVNLAILLGQPLLLMGEPGSGKTRLAEAVAAELHGEKYKQHFFRWDVKSNSKAKDGIYQYDALGRMYAANNEDAKAKSIDNFIEQGTMANAFTKKQNGSIPNVLLIDEIDKADIDFPNDLLLEIEKKRFFIPELNKTFEAKSEVIIFVTSNRERELPPAFLRRCLYCFIKFPGANELASIIHAKFKTKNDDALVTNAVNFFVDVRTRISGQLSDEGKKPATSELLEWFKAIHHYNNPKVDKSDRIKSFIQTIETYEKGSLDKVAKTVPFVQALLKTYESNQLFL